MDRQLMLGNEAIARGLYEAGCRFVSSYPGTPSTEITEYAAEYDEIRAEWAPNEKVAAEAALGASVSGARAFSGMKHVGLNVAADPMFTASYTGVNAGLVIAVADDPGMHSSQNEQDSRHYARAAKLPMLEPADSQECRDYILRAYELSEKYDTPVFVRLTTRISHSQSQVTTGSRADIELKPYVKDFKKYVMMPATARVRHVTVEARQRTLAALAEATPLNEIEWNDKKIGVIAAGIAYQYAREALGDNASYLKLGMVCPLPERLLIDFASQVETLFVIEELDDVIESHCRKIGLDPIGKSAFSLLGEYTAGMIRSVVLGGGMPPQPDNTAQLPARPPVLCPACPHRGLFHVLRKLKLSVFGDIGCYTLAASPPLETMDTCVCMGAAISMLHGRNAARPDEADKCVAVIGDSTFVHSGITGLVDIVYNQTPSTVLILDNSTTGMTGHQENPTTGMTLKNDPAPALDMPALCKAIGVRRVRTEDPNDLAGVEKALKEELAADEPSVIITKRPCALLKSVKQGAALRIDQDKCKKCKLCMSHGCPAVSNIGGQMAINGALCAGCSVCVQLCKFGAIEETGEGGGK